MDFELFQAWFLFILGIIINVAILFINFYILLLLLKNAFPRQTSILRKFFQKHRVEDASIMTNSDSNRADGSTAAGTVTNVASRNNNLVVKPSTATNAFLVSLCISNLSVGTLVLPLFIVTKYDPDLWTLGLCQAYRYFKYFAIMSNSYTNVSIAIERFRCVVYKTKYSMRAIIINILVFYVISFAIAFVEVYRYELEVESHLISSLNTLGLVCELPHETEFNERLVYAVVFFLFVIALPLVTIIILYGIILHKLRVMEAKLNQGIQSGNNTAQKSKFKVFLQSFLVLLLILFVCFLPYSVLTVIEGLVDIDKDVILFFVLDLTLILSTSHAFLTLLPYRFLLPKNLNPCTNN